MSADGSSSHESRTIGGDSDVDSLQNHSNIIFKSPVELQNTMAEDMVDSDSNEENSEQHIESPSQETPSQPQHESELSQPSQQEISPRPEPSPHSPINTNNTYNTVDYSSPFISHPELLSQEQISDIQEEQEREIEEEQEVPSQVMASQFSGKPHEDGKVHVDFQGSPQLNTTNGTHPLSPTSDLDESIANLQESMQSLKITKEEHSPFRNTLHNSTIFDDTGIQPFGIFLDSQKFDISPKRNGSDMTTPWRKFRSNPPRSFTPPVYRDSNIFGRSAQHTTTSSVIDEKNKEILRYKIQIKLYKEFLQQLLDKYGGEFEYDINHEITKFQDNLTSPSSIRTVREVNADYDEMYKLNQDLYTNLEKFERMINEKDQQLRNLNNDHDTWLMLVDDMINMMIDDNGTSESSRTVLESLDSANIETKLNAIKLEMMNRLEQSTALLFCTPQESKQDEIDGYVATIDGLLKAVESLEDKVKSHQLETQRLESDLYNEINESKKIKGNFGLMHEKFIQLKNSIQDNGSEKVKYLELENEQFKSQMKQYENTVKLLQEEVNQHLHQPEASHDTDSSRVSSRSSLVPENIVTKYLDLQNVYSSMVDEYTKLQQEYAKLQDSLANKVNSLTSRLNEKTIESRTLKGTVDKLQRELDMSLEKQRKFNTERIQVSHSADSLRKDNAVLQSKVQKLTDIISLTVEDSGDKSGIQKKLTLLEMQYKDLLQFDLAEFNKFINSFNKIADDASLKDPKLKYEKLHDMISELESFDNVGELRDKHKSIFEYFARAVDILVNDHIRMLLKENGKKAQSDSSSMQREQILQLKKENKALTQQIEELAEASAYSPISKLRMDDLGNKWKAERERRVLENKEAQKRFKEQEMEINRLTELLAASKGN
ncbi:uncharacterized protein SPAPADRAFT_68792 [Spathaspora passalidarum NRRL Y-27907]|uniref:Mto2p-binding domain-containing protein n=1 Tax=Spathaspora passalidarum (strain NRRL Y-27907 / 11-Y1) TaxID=619300 RepID=G3AVJ0_SPAPN|nr:uncharacterized protein SPAPADRAFT_68792 [Spathaspora passalidarum NRRL Y-27907]EGW29939.1 hypothetical protein SPAPADRAFT_68792 [Spathaspora passalidarum NRRL Y-27907]